MQLYGHTLTSETPVARCRLALPAQWSAALHLLLPLLLFGATLWIVQHNTRFASPDFSDNEAIDLTPTAARQVSFIALGAYGAMLLLQRARAPLAIHVPQLAFLAAGLLLIVLSAFWSEHLELALKRSAVPLLMTIAALGVAKHWRPHEACRFVATLTAIYLLLGIGAEIAQGKPFGGADYRFAGTLHPNSQAVNCAALALASMALYRDARRHGSQAAVRLWLVLFCAGTLFLVLTKSRTATAAYLIGLLFLLTLGMPRAKKLVIVGSLLIVLATGVLTLLAFAPGKAADSLLLDAAKMGRQQDTDDVTSLTGRIPIWEQILRDVALRPWLGYGYGSFWTPQRVVRYSYIHDWEFNHAHSAYLETLLNVGIVGLALGLLLIASVIRTAERAYRATGDCGYRFAAALLVMALLQGVLDGNFLIIGLETAVALICIGTVALHARPLKENATSRATQGESGLSDWRVNYA